MDGHRARILDQFSKQAAMFSEAPAITNQDALQLLLEITRASPDDTLLDVACGPGIVVCAFARKVKHATGIDLTPAMIERARILQSGLGLSNVEWETGDILPLPYAEGSFSIVSSRYAFHHMENPAAVLAEMVRVCQPRGRILVVDQVASDIPGRADALNRMERLRDPSHVRALTLGELVGLFPTAGLPVPRAAFYSVDLELEQQLKGSFPDAGNEEVVRRMILDSLDNDGLGLKTRKEGGSIMVSYPIAVLAAEKPAC